MACCFRSPLIRTIQPNILRLQFYSRSSIRNETKHMSSITTKLRCTHGDNNSANEGLNHESYLAEGNYFSLNLFKPASDNVQSCMSNSNDTINSFYTTRDASSFAKVTDVYYNVTPVRAKFMNSTLSLFRYQTLWNNISKLARPTLPSSCDISSRPSLIRMVHSWRAEKRLLGGCGNREMRGYSTAGSAGSEKELDRDGASQETQAKLVQGLTGSVNQLFTGRHDYGILHKDVVMEHNLFGKNKNSVGVLSYAVELLKFRIRFHIHYSGTHVEIKDVNILKQDGIVRINWCLTAVPQARVFNFFRFFKTKQSSKEVDIIEAYSDFHIGKEGTVVKHHIHKRILTAENS